MTACRGHRDDVVRSFHAQRAPDERVSEARTVAIAAVESAIIATAVDEKIGLRRIVRNP